MSLRRIPAPGRWGTEVFFLSSGPYGGTNLLGGAAPITANTTTTLRIGPVGRKARFLRLGASAQTLVSDTDGTVLARVRKRNNGGGTTVSNDLDLEALTANQASYAGPLTNVLESVLRFAASDVVEIDIVNNSAAINTQPVALCFTVEFAVLE